MDNALSRLESICARLEKLEAGPGQRPAAATPSKPLPVETAPVPVAASGDALVAYDALLSGPLQSLVASSSGFSGEIVQAVTTLQQGFQALRTVLEVSTRAKAPDASSLQKLVEPVGACMSSASNATGGKRTDAFNHLKTVADVMQALSWVVYTGPSCGMNPPPQHIAESVSAADFYSQKILMQYRNVDDAHVAWVKALKELMKAFETYASTHFPLGLKWNPSGVSVAEAMATAGSGTTTSGAASAPKPVQQAAAPRPAVPTPAAKAAAPAAKPVIPRLELIDNDRTWLVEHQQGVKDIVITASNMRQSVQIHKCNDCVITVKGKLISITLDSCNKTGVLFDQLISRMEVVNCKSVQLQPVVAVQLINVEKSSGVHMFLSPAVAKDPNFQIVTSQCSEVNVTALPENPDLDPVEQPIPEQFLSVFQGGKLVTTAVAHAGA